MFFWLLRYKQICQATSKRQEQDACTARGHTGSSTCHQQGSDARAPQQGRPPALLCQQVCLPGGLSTSTLLQWPVGCLTLCPATVGTAVKQYSESVHCASPLCSHAKGCPFLVCPLCLPLCSNAAGSPLLASPMCLRTMLAGNRNCNASISKPCAATMFLLVIVRQQQLLIAKGFFTHLAVSRLRTGQHKTWQHHYSILCLATGLLLGVLLLLLTCQPSLSHLPQKRPPLMRHTVQMSSLKSATRLQYDRRGVPCHQVRHHVGCIVCTCPAVIAGFTAVL